MQVPPKPWRACDNRDRARLESPNVRRQTRLAPPPRKPCRGPRGGSRRRSRGQSTPAVRRGSDSTPANRALAASAPQSLLWLSLQLALDRAHPPPLFFSATHAPLTA